MNERIRFKARKPLAPKNQNDDSEVRPPAEEKKVRPAKAAKQRKKRDSEPIYQIEQRSQNARRGMVWYYNEDILAKESFRRYDDRALTQNPVN